MAHDDPPSGSPAAFPSFEPGEAFARALDQADPLADFRAKFELPRQEAADEDRVYLLGNSLGPLPRDTCAEIAAELEAWGRRGVESYFEAPRTWYEADERYRAAMAGVVGARPEEVALTGSLTTNLHLLLASFYRPHGKRFRVLIERAAFPSDRFVVETQLAWHGIDPAEGIVEVGEDAPRPIGAAAIERVLAEHGDDIALVFIGGVNYLTGEAFDLARIVQAAHAAGCAVGFDLAHAAGNVPLTLHDTGADFAAWCTYKYLNAGPGAVAGLFVHERHLDAGTFRLGGWWGVDPERRFRSVESARGSFKPRADAAGWQLSCPPVLALAPLGPALAMFEEAGMPALRAKSERLTAYLEWLIARPAAGSRGGRTTTGSGPPATGYGLEQITPYDPARRGAQLSFRVDAAAGLRTELARRGVDVDLREPDVLRLAPAPLFNSFHDVWRAAAHIAELLEA